MTQAPLEALCPNVWRIESHIQMLPGFGLPLTMTVIRADEGLILHSPIQIDEALAAQIKPLGEPFALIAPNLFHHLHVASAKQRYPDAEVFGPEKLAKKNSKLASLTPLESCKASWTKCLQPIEVHGIPSVREFVFYHKQSETLLMTDLVFNLKHADGWISKMYLRWSDALGKPKQTKLWRFITKDRDAARESLEQLLELNIERIVVAHGDVIEGDAKAKLRNACAWMLAQ